jgi:RNA polymerase sigma-70 factor, ECF subfamily
MPPPSHQSIPNDSFDGQSGTADRAHWIATLYDELRTLAQSELDTERRNHTLSATALVNEVYLKLTSPQTTSEGVPLARLPIERGLFFGLAAQAMRRLLVDHARGRQRQKRGGGEPGTGGDILASIADPETQGSPLEAIALDEALKALASEHEQAARVVELRFFAGLTDQAIGECLGINERTVRRHWTFARAWLAREMGDGSSRDRSTPE